MTRIYPIEPTYFLRRLKLLVVCILLRKDQSIQSAKTPEKIKELSDYIAVLVFVGRNIS